MLAAMNGHTAAVKLLLDMGSDINAQVYLSAFVFSSMDSLLPSSIHVWIVYIVEFYFTQIETNRNTALTLACFQGRHEVVSLLVDRKANIEHRAKVGVCVFTVRLEYTCICISPYYGNIYNV